MQNVPAGYCGGSVWNGCGVPESREACRGAAFVDGAGAESRAPRLLGGFVQRIIKFIAAREKTLDKSRGAWYTMKCRSIG